MQHYNNLQKSTISIPSKSKFSIKEVGLTDGYDGHCLRTFFYFREQVPDIVDTVESINSIADKYEALRGKSKAPTFAMTYLGTAVTLMNNCGFSKELANTVYTRYHELYVVSDKWMDDKISQAARDGYIELAFGLRLRTPLLKQSILGTRSTMQAASHEARSVGNAVGGQSYCMLNSRALNAFMDEVWASQYVNRIEPCAAIHDANYLIIDDDLEVLQWVNNHLIKEMQWQNLPEIEHPEIKLGGELDVHFPSWKEKITLNNNATIVEIIQTLSQ